MKYERQEDGGYLVRDDAGDRLGFVRQVGDGWHAVDTYLVGLRRTYKTRQKAVDALRRRQAKVAS